IIAGGRSPFTPAIAVRWATRPDQQVVEGTLGDLAARIHHHGLRPPATIIVGAVAGLREKLGLVGKMPLFGQRIVVTRPRDQARSMVQSLHRLGAEAISLPAIEIQPANDYGPLDRAIFRLAEYDWIVFTSANGVRSFLERLDGSRSDLR